MPTVPRRVVTGHDAHGRSVFTSDGPVPLAAATPGGSLFFELWATDATPAPIAAEPSDAGAGGPASGDPASGSPASGDPASGDPASGDPASGSPAQADPAAGPLSVAPAPNGTKVRINELPPGAVSPVHRTETVDYGIVLGGEVVLVLDDSETVLRAGDVVVQRGTSHRWENRSGAAARVAFVLIDGAFTAGLRDALGGDQADEPPGPIPPGPIPPGTVPPDAVPGPWVTRPGAGA